MNDLRDKVNSLLGHLFGGNLPEDQPETTAFSMILAYELCRSSTNAKLKLFAAPKKSKTKDIVTKYGLSYEHRERDRIDILVFDSSDTVTLACESEAFPRHFTGSDPFPINERTGNPRNGYIWDFHKLLKFSAPRLLFVARVGTTKGGKHHWSVRLRRLEQSLAAYALENASDWAQSRLDIILLPEERHLKREVRLGAGLKGRPIQFENL